jgi:predicted RNA-binding Zn-ribbon protein involved in translation (DUF1610 family)
MTILTWKCTQCGAVYEKNMPRSGPLATEFVCHQCGHDNEGEADAFVSREESS